MRIAKLIILLALTIAIGLIAVPALAQPAAASLTFTVSSGSTTGSILTWRDAAGGVPGDLSRFNVNNSYGVPWIMGAASYANATDPRPDMVMNYGWNCGSGGSIPGKAGACWSIEDHYETAPGQAQSEMHYNVFGVDGVGTRAITITQQDNAPYRVQSFLIGTEVGLGIGHNLGDAKQLVQLSSTNNQVVLNSPDGTSKFTVKDGLLQLRRSSGGAYAEMSLTPEALVVGATTQGDVINSSTSGTPYGRIGYARANFSAGRRWRKAAFAWGVSVAGKTAERPACPVDSDGDLTDGTIWANTYTIEGGGHGTTFEVCGCTAAGACTWRTLYDFGP